METAEQIAKRFAPDNAVELERAILRHMAHHMRRAASIERDECAALVESLPSGFGDMNRNDVAAQIRARSQEA